jgi:uncharacterized caspase-like protein
MMTKKRFVFHLLQLAAVFCASVLAGSVHAATRVALVIGNSGYEHVSHLPNPGNDARDMSAALERLGFTVTTALDLDYRGMRTALRDFADKAAGADMAAIYYAGHGIEIDKQNYLIPVDAELKSDRDVSFEAIQLDHLMTALRDASGLKLVLLDACRNNPFGASMQRTNASRSIGRGLGRVDPPSGILVGFAAREGTVADDGKGRNSPYTTALLAHLEEPGLEIGKLFRKVRDSVYATTDGRQEPFTYGSLPGRDIYLQQLAGPEGGPSATATAPGSPEVERQTDSMIADYKLAKDVGTAKAFEAFLSKYKDRADRFYVPLAQQQLDKLLSETNEKLALADPQSDATPEVSAEPAPSPREITLGVQRELKRLGCDPGAPDGIWGAKTSSALAKFARFVGGSAVDSEPTTELLARLKTESGRVCPLECGPRFVKINDRCVVKTCPTGQRLSSAGQCYTPAAPRSATRSQQKQAPSKPSGSCFTFDGKTFCE